jgi:pimeloyl-ACP methyl ester carboxylesterase
MASESDIDFAKLPRVALQHVELAYFERGEGPLVLCLHGFPDNACAWLPLLDVLSEQGYRAVAPFMRGFYPSTVASNGDYSVVALAQDVLDLIAALHETSAIVIGHDWGGMAAFTAANMQPQTISKLVVANAPHLHKAPFTFSQVLKSWYVLFFQLPWLPQRTVAYENFRFIDDLYRAWSPQWAASADHLDSVKSSLSAPGSLMAALGYYRAMLRRINGRKWALMSKKTTVPALVIAGEVDGSTGSELFSTSVDCYENLYELIVMPGVGHFPHQENPDGFAEAVLRFMQQ